MDNNTRQAMFAAYWGCETISKCGIDNYSVFDETFTFIDYESYLLRLTPLSKITDEHAQIVADIWNKTDELCYLNCTIDNVKSYFLKYGISTLTGCEIDILRSLGYDAGFREIDSLIDAGYAVDKTL